MLVADGQNEPESIQGLNLQRVPEISVCMAAYNGSRYIQEQIHSILLQLGERGELIVVNDCSQDDTGDIVEGIRDERIRAIRNPSNLGVIASFERAIQEARGEIIFLSDQDDRWSSDKVRAFLAVFAADPRVTLVVGNGELIDADGQPLEERLYSRGGFSAGVVTNLIKNRYQGSTMAFRREVAEVALPFPKGLPMHDSWIGLVNAIIGRAAFLDEPLLFYRRHGGNVTTRKHGSTMHMLAERWTLAKELVFRVGRLLRAKRDLKRNLGKRVAVPARGG
ncbi:MAG TPA: glycosyltransferase family 2 protein [Candidatus Acidoferrum sp.]|jgi:glycosyltransferase involved in cell wall biosynthesis